MSEYEMVASIVAVAILGSITLGLSWYALAGQRRPNGSCARNRDGSFETVCAICATRSDVPPDALIRLSSAEKALVVRESPAAVGKDLVEFVCPHCDASHCFSAGRDALVLVGVNLYEGQQLQVHCKECRKSLDAPPWPAGSFDGHWSEAPGDITSLGLVCALCGATCCVACCKIATRNRTSDGSLLCPRCYRGPLESFYHPAAANLTRN